MSITSDKKIIFLIEIGIPGNHNSLNEADFFPLKKKFFLG